MPSGPLAEVRLIGFPLPLWQRSQEHIDELLREFALIAQSDEASVPRRLLNLVAELTAAYAGVSTNVERERDEAILRGDTEIDLLYQIPPQASEAVRALGDMLDEADDYCRQGSHLLTLQTPPDQLRFRKWFLAEFADQIGGASPTSWPDYAATR
ncbi:MAG: hypothetical protein ABR540_20160 [Acidimicrobiales bacterium]